MSLQNPLPAAPLLGTIQAPDDRALQLLHEKEISSNLNCVQIGTIVSFDAASQSASVSINMTRQISGVAVAYPLLINCPVVINRGGAGYMTLPITAGDPCIVLFNDRDIDKWFVSGQTNLVPTSNRLHSLSDGIVIVGAASKPGALGSYSVTNAELGIGASKISISPAGVITIAAASTVNMIANSVTLKSILDELMTDLTSWVNSDSTTPNGATVTALNATKAKIDAFFT